MAILQLPSRRGHVPAGGTTGQVIKKNSGDNWDYNWADVSGGGTPPGGLTGYLQYNNNGVLGGIAPDSGASNQFLTGISSGGITKAQPAFADISGKYTPKVTTITSSATPSINTDTCDAVTITAQAADITSMTTGLTGTPHNFDKLIIRIKDNGTPRGITWGTSFLSSQLSLPTTTVASKVTTIGFMWDSVKAAWICLALDQEP